MSDQPVAHSSSLEPSLAGSPASPPLSPVASSKPGKRWRRWVFRLLATALSLSGLVLVEGVLRLCGVGHDVQLIVPAETDPRDPSRFQFNPHFDLAYYGGTDLSGPEPRHFTLPKPQNTLRVVVIGGSTVIGFPFPAELAFPRHLELALKNQHPGLEIEVLNAGITAVNSEVEADVLQQAIVCEPDVIVVYTGHNEFYGPGGVGSRVGASSPWLFRLSVSARRTRIGQLIAALVSRQGNQSLMETLPGDLRIPLDGLKFQEAVRRFRLNLTRMTETARAANVPLMLVSPIGNDRHQSPMQSLSRLDLSEEQVARFHMLLTSGEEALQTEKPQIALEQFQLAAEIDSGHALLTFRRAQVLQALNRRDEAAAEFQRARDQDGCRFRAPSHFTTCLRDVVQAADSERILFLDLPQAFASQAIPVAFGHEWFFEHVHFTQAGHWAVAQAIGKSLTADFLKHPWNEKLVPTEAQRDEKLAFMVQDQLVADSLTLMAVSRPPLNLAPDHVRQSAFWTGDLRQQLSRLSAIEAQAFADLPVEAMQQDLIESLLPRYFEAGRYDLEIDLWRRRIARRPWLSELYRKRANSLGGPAERLAALQQILPPAP